MRCKFRTIRPHGIWSVKQDVSVSRCDVIKQVHSSLSRHTPLWETTTFTTLTNELCYFNRTSWFYQLIDFKQLLKLLELRLITYGIYYYDFPCLMLALLCSTGVVIGCPRDLFIFCCHRRCGLFECQSLVGIIYLLCSVMSILVFFSLLFASLCVVLSNHDITERCRSRLFYHFWCVIFH